MAKSEEMDKPAVLSTRVDPEVHRRIMSLIKQAGSKQGRFILDAVTEKLARGGIDVTSIGPLADLPIRDRMIVEDLIVILREHPDNTLLHDVIQAHRIVLMALAKRGIV